MRVNNFVLKLVIIAFIENCYSDHCHETTKRHNEKCGVASTPLVINRIAMGDQFVRGKWPWMVSLMSQKEKEPLEFFCGGTLVSTTKVVTGKKYVK